MNAADTLDLGRKAFLSHAWADAYDLLSAADRETSLSPEDLEQLAVAASLVGRDAESFDFWTRAHYAFLSKGETQRALRSGFWLSFALLIQGESARSNGWLARCERLVADVEQDCAEQGYLLLPAALQCEWRGDSKTGLAKFEQAAMIGRRFREPDLTAFALMGVGETLIELGETSRGLSILDEVMAAVTAGELSTLAVGIAYCAVVGCCQRILDLRRSVEWAAAFARWCESQPDVSPYRGECSVYRSEIMQLQGAWPTAMEEAQRACERALGTGSRAWAGGAFYQRGELHRLRGEFEKAEAAYRQANEWGLSPQPGLALLRLAQGRTEVAVAAISRTLSETHDNISRSRILPAHVEIMLAAHQTQAAQDAADELRGIAASRGLSVLNAASARATGAVLLGAGDASAALAALRTSLSYWREIDVPYEAARVRVLLALACRLLGDEDSALLELDAARRVFQQLGAMPDLERVVALSNQALARDDYGLTAREIEVLRLVAAGKTNRMIAAELVLSEKTIARHVSNIFAKLNLSSRSAATAYAFEHALL